MIELAEELRTFFAPDGLTRAFFTSGGGDSVETALRLARQYHKIRGEAGRVKFLSLKKGYHGTHIGGASVNGNANFRTAYEPLLPGCFHIPAPYTYRNPFNETDPAQAGAALPGGAGGRNRLSGRRHHRRLHHGADPWRGRRDPAACKLHAGGARDLSARHGILLIADEVITAFGRTGAWTGSRLWGVKPDLTCTAKAITNGYFPFGAVMIAEGVAEVFEQDETGAAAIGHGYTYSGHPVGAAAALACLAETKRLKVNENAAARGAQLHAGTAGVARRNTGHRRCARRPGLMLALELVADRATKKPADKAAASQGAGSGLSRRGDGAGFGAQHHPVATAGADHGRRAGDPCGVGGGTGGALDQRPDPDAKRQQPRPRRHPDHGMCLPGRMLWCGRCGLPDQLRLD